MISQWNSVLSLYSLCVCLLDCEFPARVHRARRGTVGSWGPPAADSRTRPCKRRTPSPSILFYLEAERNDASTRFTRCRNNDSIRARLSQRAFHPLPLLFFLSFFFTDVSPTFCSSDAFCTRRATVNREEKKRGKGWVGKVCLLRLTGCRFEYYYEWNVWEDACATRMCPMPASFFHFFLDR